MTTLNNIKTAVETVRTSYQKRIEKALIDNFDRHPTYDKDGRAHAPCDNYIWINDQVYLGGQYLPDDSDYVSGAEKLKIKIALSILPEIESFLGGKIGKPWNQNGIEVAYFYAVVSKAEKTAILKILPESGKRVVLATENTTTKTWKFSTGKFTRRFASIYGFEWHGIFEVMSREFAPGVAFNLIRKKDGKYTFKSDFDGKMVCYEYFDNTIYS